VSTAGAPDIEKTFELAHASTAAVLFLVPGAIALAVEPVIFLLADRYPRRWFIAGGLAFMAVGAFWGAIADSALELALSITLWGCASGPATSLSQATLVDRDPDRRARTLARWSIMSLAGDVLAPLALAGFALAGMSWRASFATVGVMIAACAIAAAIAHVPNGEPERDPDAPSTWQAFRAALHDRTLILWLFGCTLCDLLDEILVVFASLHARTVLGAGPMEQAAILASFMIGGAVGLAILDRLLVKRGELWLLIACGLACLVAYGAWLCADTPWLSAVLIFPVGATAMTLYPLCAARAYARLPGRSSIVLAANQLFTPIGLVLPWLLGLVADAAGTVIALALLAVQPLGLVLLAARELPKRNTADGVGSADRSKVDP
jgi:MFS family permease